MQINFEMQLENKRQFTYNCIAIDSFSNYIVLSITYYALISDLFEDLCNAVESLQSFQNVQTFLQRNSTVPNTHTHSYRYRVFSYVVDIERRGGGFFFSISISAFLIFCFMFIWVYIPLRLLRIFECYMYCLSILILTRNSLTLFDDAIGLQQRFDVFETCLQRYAAY